MQVAEAEHHDTVHTHVCPVALPWVLHGPPVAVHQMLLTASSCLQTTQQVTWDEDGLRLFYDGIVQHGSKDMAKVLLLHNADRSAFAQLPAPAAALTCSKPWTSTTSA